MGPKKANLRSGASVIVKEFGVLNHLPRRTLKKADTIARFNGLRGVMSYKVTPCYSNFVMSETQAVTKLSSEILELYGKFALKCQNERTIQIKVKKIKDEYYKARKKCLG